MQNKLYFRLGLFVFGSLILLVAMLFALGLKERFAKRIHFVTSFQESVQGLTKGAPVKYKGVPIGMVENLTILPEHGLVKVDMSIDPKNFSSSKEEPTDEKIRKRVQEAQSYNIGCRLELAGVTGLRYVEVDTIPQGTQLAKEPPFKLPDDAYYFPGIPSTINNIIASVGTSLDKIAKIDFAKISNILEKNLQDINQLLGDPAITNSIAKIEKITTHLETMSKNLSESLTGEEVRKLLNNLNGNLNDLELLTSQLRQKIADINPGKLSDKMIETMDSVSKLANDLDHSRVGFDRMLRQLGLFLNSTGEFLDYLKHDPNSLLRGKSAPPIVLEP